MIDKFIDFVEHWASKNYYTKKFVGFAKHCAEKTYDLLHLEKIHDKQANKKIYKFKIARKKAIDKIEKNCFDLQTKQILTDLAGFTKKDYKRYMEIRKYINEIRENAPGNNNIVQKRIREIINEV